MNTELIDTIAFDSGCHRHSFHDPHHSNLDGFIISRETLDKFAEAIVNECRKVIVDFDGVEDYEYKLNPRSVRWECSFELRDHFRIRD